MLRAHGRCIECHLVHQEPHCAYFQPKSLREQALAQLAWHHKYIPQLFHGDATDDVIYDYYVFLQRVSYTPKIRVPYYRGPYDE